MSDTDSCSRSRSRRKIASRSKRRPAKKVVIQEPSKDLTLFSSPSQKECTTRVVSTTEMMTESTTSSFDLVRTASLLHARVARGKTMILAAGQLYRFSSDPVGRFRIRGGSTGNATIDGALVTIRDSHRTLIFSEGGEAKDRVTLQDHPKNGTSLVTFIPGGTDLQQSVDTCNPLQGVGLPGEAIVIRGKQVVINGNGGHLIINERAQATVNGNVEDVYQSCRAHLIIHGSVHGSVNQKRLCPHLCIEGNIVGDIIQQGNGVIMIGGDVRGNITQIGKAFIHIMGTHQGRLCQHGNGDVQIVGGPQVDLSDPDDEDGDMLEVAE